MPTETTVTSRYDSATLYGALRELLDVPELRNHEFDPSMDDLQVMPDADGTSKVSVTFAFRLGSELTKTLLATAYPRERPDEVTSDAVAAATATD